MAGQYDIKVRHSDANPGERVCTTVELAGPPGDIRLRFRIDGEKIEDQRIQVAGTTFVEFFWTMAPGNNKFDVQILDP